MRFFSFTPQEIKALLFLLIALLIGSGITLYKKYHRSFAPELILNESPLSSFENQSQFNEAPKDKLCQGHVHPLPEPQRNSAKIFFSRLFFEAPLKKIYP